MSEQPESIRRFLLPISPADPTTTPPEFGAPLHPIVVEPGNAFIDKVPAWVMIRPMFAQIKFAETWSTLDPDAQFTSTDLGRIEIYNARVDWLGYRLHDPSVRPPAMSSLLYSRGRTYFIPDDRDPNDPDDDGEDTGETLCSPIDFLRQFTWGDPDDPIGNVVKNHDCDQAEGKIQATWSWLEEAPFGSDGL